MKTGFIYKLISPNNKIYIGQTINLNNRKRKYKYNEFKKQLKLWNNCQKYNWNPYDNIEIIEEIFIEFLNEREIFWINYYDSYLNGLNCNIGGNGNLGRIVSEETKEKIRKANIGKKHSEEAKIKISKANIGKIQTEETKEKIKKTKNKNPYVHSDEMKKYISEKNKGNKKRIGKIHTEETKNKISKSKKGIPGKNTKKVLCLTNNVIYDSVKIAAEELNCYSSKISAVCREERKTTKGYKFIYI